MYRHVGKNKTGNIVLICMFKNKAYTHPIHATKAQVKIDNAVYSWKIELVYLVNIRFM